MGLDIAPQAEYARGVPLGTTAKSSCFGLPQFATTCDYNFQTKTAKWTCLHDICLCRSRLRFIYSSISASISVTAGLIMLRNHVDLETES